MPEYPQIVGVAQAGTSNHLVVNADGSINVRSAAQAEYQTVAAGQTDDALGAAGAIGDLLSTLICTVATSATSAVSVKDGDGSAIPVLPANTAIGVHTAYLNLTSAAGGWSVTTGAGVTVVATGSFSD